MDLSVKSSRGEIKNDDFSENGATPAKTISSFQRDYCQHVNLLHFSDDVLLQIFKKCSPRDLKALGFTCTRFGNLIKDHTLWNKVDFREQPSGLSRMRWMISNVLHEGTTELKVTGYSRESRGCYGHLNKTREQSEEEYRRDIHSRNSENLLSNYKYFGGQEYHEQLTKILDIEFSNSSSAKCNQDVTDKDIIIQTNGISTDHPVEITKSNEKPGTCNDQDYLKHNRDQSSNINDVISNVAENGKVDVIETPTQIGNKQNESLDCSHDSHEEPSCLESNIHNVSTANKGNLETLSCENNSIKRVQNEDALPIKKKRKTDTNNGDISGEDFTQAGPSNVSRNVKDADPSKVNSKNNSHDPGINLESRAENLHIDNNTNNSNPRSPTVSNNERQGYIDNGICQVFRSMEDFNKYMSRMQSTDNSQYNIWREEDTQVFRSHGRLNKDAQPSNCNTDQSSMSSVYRCDVCADNNVHLQSEDKCYGPVLTLSESLTLHLKWRCPNLTVLHLDYCNIDCNVTSISMLPGKLKELSMVGARLYNHPVSRSYFFMMNEYLPSLELLDLSHCEWFEANSILPISKLPNLKVLRLKNCPKLSEFVAYASIAARYGLKKLKVLDMRGSPVGDSEVSAFSWLPELQELYVSCTKPQKELEAHAHYKYETSVDDSYLLEPWETEVPPCFHNSSIQSDIEYYSRTFVSIIDRIDDDEPTPPSKVKATVKRTHEEKNGEESKNDGKNEEDRPGPSKRVRKNDSEQPDIEEFFSVSLKKRIHCENPKEERKTDKVDEGASTSKSCDENPKKAARNNKDNKIYIKFVPGLSPIFYIRGENMTVGSHSVLSCPHLTENDEHVKNSVSLKAPRVVCEERKSEQSKENVVENHNDSHSLANLNTELNQANNDKDEGIRDEDQSKNNIPNESTVNSKSKSENSLGNKGEIPVGEREEQPVDLSDGSKQIITRSGVHHCTVSRVNHYSPCSYMHNRCLQEQDPSSFVTDSSIRRFGTADGAEIHFVFICPNGQTEGKPHKSNLRILSATGFRYVTDNSLIHLATAAPHLRYVDFTNTNVTHIGVMLFQQERPDCEVVYSPYVDENDA